jgi:hypothetical protein
MGIEKARVQPTRAHERCHLNAGSLHGDEGAHSIGVAHPQSTQAAMAQGDSGVQGGGSIDEHHAHTRRGLRGE